VKGFAENFVNTDEALYLRSLDKRLYLTDLHPESTPYYVFDRLKDYLPDFEINLESYMEVRHVESGEAWKMKGPRGCTFCCLIMISRDYEYVGGTIQYGREELDAEYRGLIWHKNKTRHSIDRHQGVRVVCEIYI